MIKVLFFASVRDNLGTGELELATDRQQSVRELIRPLLDRGEQWQSVLGNETSTLVAINQEMANHDAVVRDGDELAFFPPVTGG